jgi:putative intracellular protease/amidase
MAKKLEGKRIAILVENGFEQVELTEPRKALEEAGAKTTLASLSASSPSVGVAGGNARRHIAARSGMPGKGKSTTKRRRLVNAGSMASLTLVVRTARPR